MSRFASVWVRLLAIGSVLSGGCVSAAAASARDRFHLLQWRVNHYDMTINAKGEDTHAGPTLRASAYVIDDQSGRTVLCESHFEPADIKSWSSKPIECKGSVTARAGQPDHRYAYTTDGMSGGSFGLVSYFRIDQDDATISFCLIGTTSTECSAETPLPSK